MELSHKTLVVNPAGIGFFRFILEGYDNLATLTTTDARDGRVILRYPAQMEDEIELILQELSLRLTPASVLNRWRTSSLGGDYL